MHLSIYQEPFSSITPSIHIDCILTALTLSHATNSHLQSVVQQKIWETHLCFLYLPQFHCHRGRLLYPVPNVWKMLVATFQTGVWKINRYHFWICCETGCHFLPKHFGWLGDTWMKLNDNYSGIPPCGYFMEISLSFRRRNFRIKQRVVLLIFHTLLILSVPVQ